MLHFEGCPNLRPTAEILHEVLEQETPGYEIEMVDVEQQGAHKTSFSGSPTILVDGKDLFPTGSPGEDFTCRIYKTPEGLKGHPTQQMLREALRTFLGSS